MKYIRTKDDKILSFTPIKKYENDKTTFEWFVANYCGGGINILKQADTIKELCDEFVVAYEDGARIVYSDLEWAKCKAKTSPIKSTIYGAIWTDKGLIYVAKMNEKGELELL